MKFEGCLSVTRRHWDIRGKFESTAHSLVEGQTVDAGLRRILISIDNPLSTCAPNRIMIDKTCLLRDLGGSLTRWFQRKRVEFNPNVGDLFNARMYEFQKSEML